VNPAMLKPVTGGTGTILPSQGVVNHGHATTPASVPSNCHAKMRVLLSGARPIGFPTEVWDPPNPPTGPVAARAHVFNTVVRIMQKGS